MMLVKKTKSFQWGIKGGTTRKGGAQSTPGSFRVNMEAQKNSPLSLKESNMLRQMAEIEENLEKCSKEATNLEQEIAKTKSNVATIEEYIEILASQPELCPSVTKGLSWNKRIAL